jgi:hypothetical protein
MIGIRQPGIMLYTILGARVPEIIEQLVSLGNKEI